MLHAVNAAQRATVPNSHPALIAGLKTTGDVPDTMRVMHLQVVLKPSDDQLARLETLVAAQHDPASPTFHHWLTPEQYGKRFGLADSDIDAVRAWLVSEGFTVHAVYPNKTQIDFSGDAGLVRKAFRAPLRVYADGAAKHIANANDIAVPAALSPVIAGVLGLHDFHPVPQHLKARVLDGAPGAPGARLRPTDASRAAMAASPMAVTFESGTRGLVPDDLIKMYGADGLRAQGITGKGVTIAVVEDNDMVPADWSNFTKQFHLDGYGGTFTQFQPQVDGMANCLDGNAVSGIQADDEETLLDAEWATAMAPGAHIEVATCADADAAGKPVNDNFFGGVYMAASNLVNGSARPDIISASYGFGEHDVDAASKTAFDLMWAQADAEGIAVFVSTGDSGANASWNGAVIRGYGINANAVATSPHVTAVGGTDTADVLDGTTAKYFSRKAGPNYGTLTGYVPEIPWNQSCGNEVAAATQFGGFPGAVAFCKYLIKYDQQGWYVTSEGASGGPSIVDGKPAWQRIVHGAAKDQSRDIPDVALFAGSYGEHTYAVVCTAQYPCTPGFTTPIEVTGGTSLSSPLFAGLQALVEQGLAKRGVPSRQGNAAPTLYALAQAEYGGPSGKAPASLARCSADNGRDGTQACVFHNITRGSIATECLQSIPSGVATSQCYFIGTIDHGDIQIGLSSTDAKKYNDRTAAYVAQPGWSFASGLGSVNAANLLNAWAAFDGVPPATH
ncbi:hypothetical protein VI08_06455 [Luteibacter yeojuensis]|uniref:Peptidase S53 domain-containing protein n=1 Tax=Luteibacter yeojuensis TaxID=345309 RepID=A0A0F3KY88_9GAMM|nr:hypothetical protein VI08_06455 [Luteibacter yeojuensis]